MTAYGIKGTVSEDDVYALVQRYGASTIFTLLQEISQATERDVTIDWRTLVKATSTGISSAREYQMLWRHLAYRDPLEKVDGGEPLSDESDLECELEVTPNLSKELSAEVDCCVKVLLSSGTIGDYGPLVASAAEALPTTCTTNDQAQVAPPDKQHLSRYNRSTNGAAPLSQKQHLSVGLSIEGLDGNGSINSVFPAKKKRKLWSKEEDMELIAAVEKFGEGNWANILKGDFKHDRTASQLSQRWAIIRKRQTNSNQSSSNKSKSEEMLAAQKAFSMALNMPMSGSLSTILSGGTQLQIANSSPSMVGGTTSLIDESQATTSQTFKQNQPPVNQEPLSPRRVHNILNKARSSQKKPQAQLKSSICPNPLIKAAAFAAGGRIATPSTAASLFKAAQSKNVVRIRHGGGTSFTGSTTTSSTTISSPSSTNTTPIPAGSHSVNPRFTHPSTSKLCHAQAAAGKASSLPQSTSMQHLLSESKSSGISTSCGLQSKAKRRHDIIISAIDVDELLAEEGRGAQGKGASNAQITEMGASSRVLDGEVNESQCSENAYMQIQELS